MVDALFPNSPDVHNYLNNLGLCGIQNKTSNVIGGKTDQITKELYAYSNL